MARKRTRPLFVLTPETRPGADPRTIMIIPSGTHGRAKIIPPQPDILAQLTSKSNRAALAVCFKYSSPLEFDTAALT